MKFLATFLLLHPAVLLFLDGSVVSAASQDGSGASGGPKRPASQQQPTAQYSFPVQPPAGQNGDSGFMSKLLPSIKSLENIVVPAFETTGIREDFTEFVNVLNEISQDALQLLGVSDDPTGAKGATPGTGASRQQQPRRRPRRIRPLKRQLGPNAEAEDDLELPEEWRKWTQEEQELM